MKTLKEIQELELEELPSLFGEERKASPKDLPAVLLMKRKSIRQFPDGRKVALYYVDKIHKYVTVPYDSNGTIGISEEN